MSKQDLITEATKRIKSRPGYNFRPEALSAKIEAGLVEGDTAKSGPLTLRYDGDDRITVHQGDKQTYQGPANQQQLDMILMLVAMAESQSGTSTGSPKV